MQTLFDMHIVAVKCGTPADGINTLPVDPNEMLFYGDTYTYTCLDNHQTDTATTQCRADGSFLLDPPPTCGKHFFLYRDFLIR